MWFDIGVSIYLRLIKLKEIEQFPSIAESFISEHRQMRWKRVNKFVGCGSLDRRVLSSNSELCPLRAVHDME